jgi:flagellin
MSVRINTNVASMTVQRNFEEVSNRLQGNYSRLSSGLRIATAADDAAGLGVSERMRATISSLTVAHRNTQDGLSMGETAEGSLQQVDNTLVRMRELAVQSANGTLSSADRTTIDTEFQQLVQEIDRISGQTDFNGIVLLDGSQATVDIQVGVDAGDTISLSLPDTSAATLNIDTLDVTNVTNASAAITAIDAAVDTVNDARGQLGAQQNRLTTTMSSILSARDNLAAAESRIRDVDVASESADLTRNTILQQAAASVLAQANVQPQIALQLLRG